MTIHGERLPDDAAPYDQQIYKVGCDISANQVTFDFQVAVYQRFCGTLSDLFQDTLVDLDGDFNVIPAAAESWEVSDDGLTWTFHIAPGLQWSDGTPLTLNDFVWNLDWAIATAEAGVGCAACTVFNPLIDTSLEGDAYWAPENRYIESVEVSEDGLSAAMKYRKNYAGWLGVLQQQLIAPQYWANVANDDIAGAAVPGTDSLLEQPVNGPFLVSAASSEGIDYVHNPLWTADTGPYLDQLRLRFYGSKDGEFTAFLNGEIDVTLNTSMADVKALQSVDPSIGRAQVDDRLAAGIKFHRGYRRSDHVRREVERRPIRDEQYFQRMNASGRRPRGEIDHVAVFVDLDKEDVAATLEAPVTCRAGVCDEIVGVHAVTYQDKTPIQS